MINAMINGQLKPNVTKLVATDGTNNAEVILSESGVIPTPTGTKEITENGEVDVLNFAKALVNVAGAGGGEMVEGTYYCDNWNTKSSVPFGETWEDYIAVWEYLGEIPEGTTNKTFKGIALHSKNTINLASEFNLVTSFNYPEGTSGGYGYSIMSVGEHPNQTDEKFFLKTLYALPDGWNSVNPNIRYKVYKL